ncbi:MAG: hypothetical protein WBA74_13345, partial [Cyclobacteriaceae bacterium]
VGDNINKVSEMLVNAVQYKKGSTFYIPLLYNGNINEGVYLVIVLHPQTYEISRILQFEHG